jgi:hypothetical protein
MLLALVCAGFASAQVDSLPPATAPPDSEAPMAGKANLSRAQFTTEVIDREPVDDVQALDTTADRVYFFTEFVGLSGGTLVHRWVYGGETAAEVPIHIGGPRWRAYSHKTLDPGSTGTWTVQVVDERGTIIAEHRLQYEKVVPPSSGAATATEDTLQ